MFRGVLCLGFESAFAKKNPGQKHSRAITAAVATCHKHSRAITAAFAQTKTLPQALVSHHRGICRQKDLTTCTREPSPLLLPRQNPTTSTREPSPRQCQDKNLTKSTREPSPLHLPRQKPYHKHSRAITASFAKTKTLPKALLSH